MELLERSAPLGELLAKLGLGSRGHAAEVARRLGVAPAKDREPGALN